ncbi:hypothetical protein TDB9533_04450 [Thalassocella blandensis]|nr:hypothetical protein TDB9533_04450 [Thalassocella blandensis]
MQHLLHTVLQGSPSASAPRPDEQAALAQPIHLSYCTNIHPGENWEALYLQLQQHLPSIKNSVSPNTPMGVGLRLSARAANELLEYKHHLDTFKQWLEEQALYVFTINGFPYGTFHATADIPQVKENVYEPDWTRPARLHYSQQLAEILAHLLPENCHGSISTVPVGFRTKVSNDEALQQATQHLITFAEFAQKLQQRTGKYIRLALEPEPACYLETIEDVQQFFTSFVFNTAHHHNIDLATVRRHIGVCLDTCHSSVMFEEPQHFVAAMATSDIPIYKIQVTAALKIDSWQASHYAVLKPYAEPTYLHQTCIRDPHTGEVRFFLDLDQALESVQTGEELRSHFHVPVFAEELHSISTTQQDVTVFLQDFKRNPCCEHLEVETYTFDVLPDTLMLGNISQSISREISWVSQHLQST